MSDKIHTDAEDILQELQNKNKQKVNNSCGCSHEEPESVAQTQSEGSCGCSHEEPSHGHEHSSAGHISTMHQKVRMYHQLLKKNQVFNIAKYPPFPRILLMKIIFYQIYLECVNRFMKS